MQLVAQPIEIDKTHACLMQFCLTKSNEKRLPLPAAPNNLN